MTRSPPRRKLARLRTLSRRMLLSFKLMLHRLLIVDVGTDRNVLSCHGVLLLASKNDTERLGLLDLLVMQSQTEDFHGSNGIHGVHTLVEGNKNLDRLIEA